MYEGKSALVTGGMGFVGRNLVSGLLSRGARSVIVVDDCSNSSDVFEKEWNGRVELVKQSVLNQEWYHRIDEVEHVFHLACKTVLECEEDPELDLEVNALSTVRMLEYIKCIEPEKQPRYIYTSSASVYGVTPDFAVDELYPIDPCSQYGVSKLAGERYVRMYAKTYGLKASALRLSNVYGPGQTPSNPYCGVIGIFLEQAKSHKPLTIIGDGSQTRDFTFVDDTIDAIARAGFDSRADGKVLNVSSGVATSVRNIAEAVIAIYPGAEIGYVSKRVIDNIQHREVDSSRIKSELDWSANISLQEGLRRTHQWMSTTV